MDNNEIFPGYDGHHTGLKLLQLGLFSNETESSECGQNALTDSYGWLIQGILAALAFGLLIVKRFCEPAKRRRSWLVWFYDTSKQGFGAAVIHFTNIFLAEEFVGDPCTWYIVSFLLDSTVGLGIVWVGIRLSIYIGRRKRLPTLLFGEYGRPPSVVAWFHQCLVYMLVMIVEKLIITGLMGLPVWDSVRDLILHPFPTPKTRVAFSVLIVPFVINAMIFWITDNILMFKVEASDLPATDRSAIVTTFSPANESNPMSKVSFRRNHSRSSTEESDRLLLSDASQDDELLGRDENLQSSSESSPSILRIGV